MHVSRARLAALLLVAICALGIANGTSSAASNRADRYATLKSTLQHRLTTLDQALAASKPGITTQELMQGGLAALALHSDAQKAELFVDTALSRQDVDTTSATYGEIPWDAFDSKISDRRADELAMQPVGPMLLQFGSVLPADFVTRLRPNLVAAIAALQRQNVKAANTSTYLMKAVDLLLLGEALSDDTTAKAGYAMLATWIAYTNEYGVHEFDTPIEYAADLDSLNMAYLYARLPYSRGPIRAALDFLWRDIAANTFDGTLSGPASVTDDFVTGAGPMDDYLYIEGLRSTLDTSSTPIARIFTWMIQEPGSYHPPSAITKRAARREIGQRWDADFTHSRYLYVTPEFSMGSATGAFNPQDRMIQVSLEGLPQAVSISPDSADDPYGDRLTRDPAGHLKPHHLALGAVTAQDRGVMLSTLAIDISHTARPNKVSTNVLLPDDAKEIETSSPRQVAPRGRTFSLRLPPSTTIGVRGATSAVALRVFPLQCFPPGSKLVLKADARGLKLHAARLVLYHNCGASHPRTIELAVLMEARRVTAERQFRSLISAVSRARVSNPRKGTNWASVAHVSGETLTVYRDSAAPDADYELIRGSERIYAPQVIDGRSYHIVQ